MIERPPDGLTFTPSNDELDPTAVFWTKVPDNYGCAECKARGGWLPKIDNSDCPNCWGGDEIGEPYCGECDWCCGC